MKTTTATNEKTFTTMVRACWFDSQKNSTLGVDTGKCSLKDYINLCKELIDINSVDITKKASHIYDAISQINVCEDFACNKYLKGKKRNPKWIDNLSIEYFTYYFNGEKHIVYANEIIKGEDKIGNPIDPYRIKTMIVGTCNAFGCSNYNGKRAVADY